MGNILFCNFSNSGTRNEVRMRVVNKFSEEIPGTGTGSNASKYNYYVEELPCGNHIILTRPANLKNGFDFLIRVENHNFSNKRDYPKHDDILSDLAFKKVHEVKQYESLLRAIEKVHNCKKTTPKMCSIDFNHGYSSELILKVLKWFFIEQDIRYWNYSGRNMLLSKIIEI